MFTTISGAKPKSKNSLLYECNLDLSKSVVLLDTISLHHEEKQFECCRFCLIIRRFVFGYNNVSSQRSKISRNQ